MPFKLSDLKPGMVLEKSEWLELYTEIGSTHHIYQKQTDSTIMIEVVIKQEDGFMRQELFNFDKANKSVDPNVVKKMMLARQKIISDIVEEKGTHFFYNIK